MNDSIRYTIFGAAIALASVALTVGMIGWALGRQKAPISPPRATWQDARWPTNLTRIFHQKKSAIVFVTL
jgi:hypothetical protein